MKLPRVTLDEFLSFEPCWQNSEKGRRRLRYYARKLGGSADALEILALRMIPAKDRLWAVLRAEFIPTPILHEIACRCAEDALSRIDNPDPRSINAIAVKRRWIAGEATDEELAAAEAAAWVARTPAQDAVEAATLAAQTATLSARTAARAAALAAAQDVSWAAWHAACAAAETAWAAACAAAETAWAAVRPARAAADVSWAARNAQVDMLTQMLREYVAGDRR